MDKVTKKVSTNHNLFEEKGEPKRYRSEVLPLTSLTALPLGQTGSHRRHSPREPLKSLNCDYKQGDLFYFAGPHGNH